MPELRVVFRNDYHDPNVAHEAFILVKQHDGQAVLRHPQTQQEDTVPLSSLRWEDDERHAVFLDLIQQGKLRAAAKQLKEDPLLDIQGTHQKPSMHWACFLPGPPARLEKKITWLLARGVNIDQKSMGGPNPGWTALAQAIHDADLVVAQHLLDRGADFKEATQPDNYDLMSLSASCGSFRTMGWLLAKGYECSSTSEHLNLLLNDDQVFNFSNYTLSFSGGHPLPLLHRAAIASYDDPQQARALFDHLLLNHSDPQELDAVGNTPLQAARIKNPENAHILGGLLAEIEANDLNFETPLAASSLARSRI